MAFGRIRVALGEVATVDAKLPGIDCESDGRDPAMVFREGQAEVCADSQFLVEGMWEEMMPHLTLKEFFQCFPPVPIGSCRWQAPWGIAKAIVALNDVGLYQTSVNACSLSFFNFEFV